MQSKGALCLLQTRAECTDEEFQYIIPSWETRLESPFSTAQLALPSGQFLGALTCN